jgi:hypothetical protein
VAVVVAAASAASSSQQQPAAASSSQQPAAASSSQQQPAAASSSQQHSPDHQARPGKSSSNVLFYTNATTQQRNNATTQQRNNAITQQRNDATMHLLLLHCIPKLVELNTEHSVHLPSGLLPLLRHRFSHSLLDCSHLLCLRITPRRLYLLLAALNCCSSLRRSRRCRRRCLYGAVGAGDGFFQFGLKPFNPARLIGCLLF